MERKIVGVVSGKGGVGKTSITASLASLAKKDSMMKVIVLDCDVDAPNLAIILPPDEKSKIDKKDTFTTLKSEFLEDLCNNCRQCVDDHFCEFNALHWDSQNSIPKIDFLKCEGCGACKVLCPGTKIYHSRVRYWCKKLESQRKLFLEKMHYYDSKNPNSTNKPHRLDLYIIIAQSKEVFEKWRGKVCLNL